MSVVWLLFPIAFAADNACLNIFPNVTDEDCGNLDITMEHFDTNENCTRALFKEKLGSLDLAQTILYQDSYTAIFEEQKEKVWMPAQNEAKAKYRHEEGVVDRIYLIANETKKNIRIQELALSSKMEDNFKEVSDIFRKQNDGIMDAIANITQARAELKNLEGAFRIFEELHNMYVTIRKQGNRVHICNAGLQGVNANLMHRGARGDDEQVLEECKDLLDKNLTQKLRGVSNRYCSSTETTRPRRRLLMKKVSSVKHLTSMTMAGCFKHANYSGLDLVSEDDSISDESVKVSRETMLRDAILNECAEFAHYLKTHLHWRTSEMLKEDADRVTVALTKQWTEDVEKCLEANKWKSVWLPWYNLYNLLGENNNCVQIHNIIVGCVVTTLATVVTIFFVVSCLWRARNCSCSCFRRSKPPRSRRPKYLSDSDDSDDSSDEEYYRRKRSLKARKKKGKSNGNDKKTRKHKDGRTVDKGHKKSKEEKNNKRDRRDGKRDKKKKTAESVRDDSRKAQRENCYNTEAEIKMQWLRCGEPSQSSSWAADCELGLQPTGNAQLRLQPRTTCIRAQTQPLKQDEFSTVLEKTSFHASPNAASMSTNDHLSVASGQPELLRDTHLYQHNAGPRTERSNASRCEMNGGKSVACASSTNSRQQSIESDLEAPGNLFHLPNLFPNKVIFPPISTTFPQIRTSADSTTRFGMPFTPHVGLAHQLAMQRASLTPPSSLAPIDLTLTSQTHTSLPMASAKASGEAATALRP